MAGNNQLDQIVQINISQETAAVAQIGFGTPLIVGPNAPRTLTYYTSPAGMLTDGFTADDPEYIYALTTTGQALTPTQFGVGLREVAVAQVSTITVNTAVASTVYNGAIGGVAWTYTSGSGSPTTSEIATGIAAAITTLIGSTLAQILVTAVAGSAIVTLTGIPGLAFTNTIVGSNMAVATTTPAYGIQTDINAILNADGGNLWYGMCLVGNQDYDILQTAALIETLNNIFIAASGDSGIVNSAVTTDIASILQGKAYTRTALMYSANSYNLGMDAAWLGGQLPQVPGSSTWKFKQLVGIDPDTYTANQRNTLIGVPGASVGKGVNIYEAVGGVNITEEGWMCGGQFIDVTVGIDWLKANLQTQIFTQLVNNPKIPYSDKGVGVIENVVRQVLKQGSDDGGTGLIDSTTIVISVVPVASIPQNTRAQRILPAGAITFTCRLTGAFHFIVIQGTVTV